MDAFKTSDRPAISAQRKDWARYGPRVAVARRSRCGSVVTGCRSLSPWRSRRIAGARACTSRCSRATSSRPTWLPSYAVFAVICVGQSPSSGFPWQVHRSVERELAKNIGNWLRIECLPAYAPELNPSTKELSSIRASVHSPRKPRSLSYLRQQEHASGDVTGGRPCEVILLADAFCAGSEDAR